MNELEREKTALYAAHYRHGYKAVELITWIDRYGYAKAAGLASLTRLRQAEKFTRSRAPQHHRRIEALLAIRAVEHVEDGARATRSQSAYLTWLYHRLSEEQRQWCQQQLKPPDLSTPLSSG